jgi:hypothetical protein
MANSIAFYYKQIIEAKDLQTVLRTQLTTDAGVNENLNTLLADLNSSSKVAIWRFWAWITATVIWTADVLFDKTRDDMQRIADTATVGNDSWLVDVAKDFRYNTANQQMVILEQDLITKQFIYPNPMGANEIKLVALASIIRSNSGFVNLLVAKAGSTAGSYAPLSINEKSAFESYIYTYKQFVGTNINILTQPSDFLGYDLTIRFDFTKGTPNPSDAIRDAIANAILNIGINGSVERLALEDAVQKVRGVIGIDGVWKAKGNASLEYINFQSNYQTIAGYIVITPDAGDKILKLVSV